MGSHWEVLRREDLICFLKKIILTASWSVSTNKGESGSGETTWDAALMVQHRDDGAWARMVAVRCTKVNRLKICLGRMAEKTWM